MKKNDRVIRGGQRDMERERRELERTEKKLQEDIKKAAKQGNKQVYRCYMNYILQWYPCPTLPLKNDCSP